MTPSSTGPTAALTLVFVATNERHLLTDALASLFESPPNRDMEVLVVDNASSDELASAIKASWPDVKVLTRDKRYSLAANLNYGIGEANHPYVMMCNCDVIFKEHAVERLAAFMDEHPRAGLVAPTFLSEEGEVRPSARRWYTFGTLVALKGPWRRAAAELPIVKLSVYDEWDRVNPLRVDWVPCPATLARSDALEELGPLDESLPLYFQDVDLSLRMHESGWSVWALPGAEVVHLESRASLRPFSSAWRSHLSSLFKFWLKHRGLKPRRFLMTSGAKQSNDAGGGPEDFDGEQGKSNGQDNQ